MIEGIKPREATAIINALKGGVVPSTGVQHIAVGRSREIQAFLKALEEVKAGQSLLKCWIGDYGSGKSFMLHLLTTVALKQKFVVASADFTPQRRLYANDGRGLALYTALMNNLSIHTRPEGGALPVLLEKWLEQVAAAAAAKHQLTAADMRLQQHLPLVEAEIMAVVRQLSDAGSFDFGTVVMRYYEGYSRDDEALRRHALKWLKGEYQSKLEARQALGVREIIHDHNYYDMLKNFCRLFVSIGYSGFMINLDEAVNLYKIPTATMRERNYETLLAMYNDCLQGSVSQLFINIAGTDTFLTNERRGLFSYEALKSRLQVNRFESHELRDFSQPVIRLLPLNHNEIFVLLKNLKLIYDFYLGHSIAIEDEEVHRFMEVMYNKPGAADFLTPREVIRDFLNALAVIEADPTVDKQQLFNGIFIRDERPDQQAVFNDIEEY